MREQEVWFGFVHGSPLFGFGMGCRVGNVPGRWLGLVLPRPTHAEAETFFAEEIGFAAVLQGLDKKLGVSVAVGLEVIDAAGGNGQVGRLRRVIPAADDLRFADAGGDK